MHRLVAALAIAASTLVAPSASAATWEYTYVRMSDGVMIAVAVSFPEGYDPKTASDTRTWPAILITDGYAGANSRTPSSAFADRYVVVKASIRGTGCSGGRYDLFDRRHALDGREIIDTWIPNQRWSNGDVGIYGHSYSGLTGFLIASTTPSHLRALAVSGLIADVYRDIVYPGGILNPGFPMLWHGYQRFQSEANGSADEYATHTAGGDTRCASNVATRPPRDALDDLAVQAATSPEDDSFWRARSLITYVDGIRAPIHITHQYQEEQTGRRAGPVLFEAIRDDVPKRMVLTNGVHATNAISDPDRLAWFDCYVIARGNDCAGDIADTSARVRVHFETTGDARGPWSVNAPLVSSDYPLPETAWTRFYLRAGGALDMEPPAKDEPADVYVSLPWGRQVSETTTLGGMPSDAATNPLGAAAGPDEVAYALPISETTAIAGPIALTLWASSSGPDTDFFASLIDVHPDGRHEFVQRGMLRASHGALDESASDRVAVGPHEGEIYRPHHPHTNATPIVAGMLGQYVIELFPVGHVFRAGHTLLLKVHAPPYADRWWMYGSARPPSVVTIAHDGGHASSILLPRLTILPPLGASPSCGQQTGIRCHRPLAG